MASRYSVRAACALQANGIVAHYTDTVAGLACLPNNDALERLTKLKRRSSSKGFILLAAEFSQLQNYIHCTDKEMNQIEQPSSTPTTWLVSTGSETPKALIGETNQLAVRLTSNEGIYNLCNLVGPIISTSANLSGYATCGCLQDIRKIFGPLVDYVDNSPNEGTNKPSTIIELRTGNIIRE